MNRIFFAVFFLGLFLFKGVAPVEATFPDPAIAYWNDSHSQEHKDPGFLRVHELVKEKSYNEALKILNGKIHNSGQKATALILKGILLTDMEKFPEALASLQAGAKLEMRHPALNFGNCQVYRNYGLADQAKRACSITIMQHPDSPQTHYEMARTLAATGDISGANKELGKAAELDSSNYLYPYERGMNFFYLNQFDQAEKEFEKSLKLNPSDMESLYQLAFLYAGQKKKDQAMEYIKKIYEAGSNHPNVQAAHNLEDYIRKNAMDRLPLKTDPKKYHSKRSKAFYKSGKYGLSLLEIETSAKLDPNDLNTLQILVGMYSVLLRLENNETAVKTLLEKGKDNPMLKAKSYQELGDIRLLQGKLKEAKEFYDKSSSLGDPDNLSKISLSEFPKDASIPKMHINIDEYFINPSDALNRKGEVFAHYGMNQRALAIYSMVLRLDPNHLMSKLNSATAYYNSGEYNQAISILERILITQPKHPHMLAHRILLAQAYAKKGDKKASINNLTMAVKINPGVKKAIQKDPAFKELESEKEFQSLIR